MTCTLRAYDMHTPGTCGITYTLQAHVASHAHSGHMWHHMHTPGTCGITCTLQSHGMDLLLLRSLDLLLLLLSRDLLLLLSRSRDLLLFLSRSRDLLRLLSRLRDLLRLLRSLSRDRSRFILECPTSSVPLFGPTKDQTKKKVKILINAHSPNWMTMLSGCH